MAILIAIAAIGLVALGFRLMKRVDTFLGVRHVITAHARSIILLSALNRRKV